MIYLNLTIALLSMATFFGGGSKTQPVVVVELFTSEGCSSCPSADRLLSEIVDKKEDVEVIGLSFHVDYWDYIGWKDPYADSRYTLRQRIYAEKLQSYQVYTPQMVVNGKYEFVGSDRRTWNEVLKKSSDELKDYDFDVRDLKWRGDKILFRVQSEESESVILNVAVVERSLSQDVTKGENRGRKLSHDNVVRYFDFQNFEGNEQTVFFEVDDSIKRENGSLIIYFQDRQDFSVLGAQQVALTDI